MRGQPIAEPVSASTSSIVSPCYLHQPHAIQHREGADAVGDKVRRVMRGDDGLAQGVRSAKPADQHATASGSASGVANYLKQPHITRRIEEVRPKPPPPKLR